MLDVLGLGPALEWQAREYSRRYNTPIRLEVDGDLRDVPDPHRTYLYRIVQEGLTNCARHAQAKNIHVKLEDSGGKLAVLVEDDGVGFDQHGGVAYGPGLARHHRARARAVRPVVHSIRTRQRDAHLRWCFR